MSYSMLRAALVGLVALMLALALVGEETNGGTKQTVSASPSADAEWADLAELFKKGVGGASSDNKAKDSRSDYRVWWDSFRRDFREKGIAFWERNPTDPRRLQWLKMTMVLPPPSYAKDQTELAIALSKRP